ncbi:MAG TPA: hypothetical protein DCZ01_01285 [Elusimicrobia bacterium]|nr:MAG: hypothetical protein A2X37_06950 [Elusimicrobia bacterium GWA2_66_18]OGR73943.1 MAG: hypothetical protein A2X40_01795 [Elusimicrobia bacterium GWC2_65_9]HAZ07166.1 hypothetical protein [Elusimicrobiota bacterium]
MRPLSASEVLKLLPRRAPALFIDDILELSETRIVSKYTWKDEDCNGHFPGNPVVPGIKLIEMAAQTGLVSQAIRMLDAADCTLTRVEMGSFKKMVQPGDTVVCTARPAAPGGSPDAELTAEVAVRFLGGPQDGETAFTGVISGRWMPRDTEERT